MLNWMVTEKLTETFQCGRPRLLAFVWQGKRQHSSTVENNEMQCKPVFRHVLRHVCSFVATHLSLSFLQVKKDHTSAPRSDWQTRMKPPLKGETHKDRRAHPHPQACAYISQPHIAEESATPCLCLSLYILWSAALAKLTKSLCRHPEWLTHLQTHCVFVFFLCVFFFCFKCNWAGWKKSVTGRVCQCEPLLVPRHVWVWLQQLLLCNAKKPMISTRLFQDGRVEAFPSCVSWERPAAACPRFGRITFTYWTLLVLPCRGGKRKRRRRIMWWLWCSHTHTVHLSTHAWLWCVLQCGHWMGAQPLWK